MAKQDVIYLQAGELVVDVVGESHHQEVLNRVCGGRSKGGHERECLAALIPDPSNAYDANAVKVMLIDDGAEVGLAGYLSRDDARAYGPVLKELVVDYRRFVVCDAVIRGGWKRADSQGSYGVKLSLESPAELRAQALAFLESQGVAPKAARETPRDPPVAVRASRRPRAKAESGCLSVLVVAAIVGALTAVALACGTG